MEEGHATQHARSMVLQRWRPIRGLCAGQAAPSAHRGFLNRARAVPIESLYDMACRQGRRLVLTGAPSGLRAGCTSGCWRCRTPCRHVKQ